MFDEECTVDEDDVEEYKKTYEALLGNQVYRQQLKRIITRLEKERDRITNRLEDMGITDTVPLQAWQRFGGAMASYMTFGLSTAFATEDPSQQPGEGTQEKDETQTEELRKSRLKVMRDLEKFNGKEGDLDTLEARAAEKVQQATELTEKDIGQFVAMKEALLKLTQDLDPEGAKCAEAFGLMLIRTPAFFLENNLIPGAAGQETKRTRRRRKLEEPQDLPPSRRLIDHIDALMDHASNQQHEAVLELIRLFHSKQLEKSEPQARRHLIRLAIEKGTRTAEEDRLKMANSGRQSGVTANWPKQGAGSRNRAQYEALEAKFAEQLRDSTIEYQLRLIDKEFNGALKRDRLLHVTPEICIVLERICKFSLLKVRLEELILFPKEEYRMPKDYLLPGEPEEQQHWFTRRRSASVVCELAGTGNRKAWAMLGQLLEPQVDWPIRQMVVGEACGLIGVLTSNGCMAVEDAEFRLLAKQVVDAVFIFPEEAGRWSPPEKEELDRVILNVQAAAEAALKKELPKYSPKVQEHVVKELQQQCKVASDKSNARHCKAALQRLLAAGGPGRSNFAVPREEVAAGSGPRGARPSARR